MNQEQFNALPQYARDAFLEQQSLYEQLKERIRFWEDNKQSSVSINRFYSYQLPKYLSEDSQIDFCFGPADYLVVKKEEKGILVRGSRSIIVSPKTSSTIHLLLTPH